MKMLKGYLLATFILAACVQPSFADSAKDAIDSANIAFASAFNKGDTAAAAALYAEDAAVFPPDAKRVDGRAGIEAFWKGAIEAGITDVALKALEVTEAGDFAFEAGEGSLSVPIAGGSKASLSIKYVVVWKKARDGSWHLYRDIWNSNAVAK